MFANLKIWSSNRFIRVRITFVLHLRSNGRIIFNGLNFVDIIHGKLDQKNKQLEVDYAIGRDIRPEDISKISSTLQEWCDSCESVLHTIEIQIDRANTAKAMRTKHTEDLESEVSTTASVLLRGRPPILSIHPSHCSVDCSTEEDPKNSPHRNRRGLCNGLQRIDVVNHFDHVLARLAYQKTEKQSHEAIVGR